jgi:hypothetical protein
VVSNEFKRSSGVLWSDRLKKLGKLVPDDCFELHWIFSEIWGGLFFPQIVDFSNAYVGKKTM